MYGGSYYGACYYAGFVFGGSLPPPPPPTASTAQGWGDRTKAPKKRFPRTAERIVVPDRELADPVAEDDEEIAEIIALWISRN